MQIPCFEEEALDLASINMQMKQVLALSICIPLVAVGSPMLSLQKKPPQHLDISSSLLVAAFPDLLLHHLWFSCISIVATWKHMSTSKSNLIPSRTIDQSAWSSWQGDDAMLMRLCVDLSYRFGTWIDENLGIVGKPGSALNAPTKQRQAHALSYGTHHLMSHLHTITTSTKWAVTQNTTLTSMTGLLPKTNLISLA